MMAPKNILVPIALSALLAAGCGSDPSHESVAPSPDRVVAEVNGVEITARRLEQVREASRLAGELLNPAQAGDPQRQDLDLVINGELLYQAAQEAGVEVPPERIEEQLEVCRSQFATPEEFEDHLRSAGLDEASLRREAERQLAMTAYAMTLTDDLVVDPERARQIYDQRRDEFRTGEQVRAAQILVRVLPSDDAERRRAARAKIEQAQARLAAGDDFAAVAERYSESPFAERGGDLGFFPRGRTLPEFERVAFSTSVGETTPIFETPHGFNIVRILDRRQSSVQTFEEVKTGLLMVLAREQQDEALRRHVEELRRRANIRVFD